MKRILKNRFVTALTACSVLIVAGCDRSTRPTSQSASAEDHAHPSSPPHGGTPVQIGDHGFHLELVHDSIDRTMFAYVLDDHMDKYVDVPPTSFELIARTAGQEHRLIFNPVTNAPAASNSRTSVFSAPAPGFTSVTNFEGVIPKIVLDGKSFENVTFSYPKGSRHSH
jgi:hypothetical protein